MLFQQFFRSFVRVFPFAVWFVASCAFAQWRTPTIDGVISVGEYGNAQNGTNQSSTSTGQTWCMTWDATNLYVGITNANLSEGAVVYLGLGGNGSNTGFQYDGANFASLPFPAHFVAYAKDAYREYRNANSDGGWTGATSGYGTFSSSAGNGPNTREFSIPWSAITGGGIPSSFQFFGYLISSGGFVYGQMPNDNPGQAIGTSAAYTQYFAITNTGNGSSTQPFSNEQSSGFSGADTAAFLHNTFDPFYRSLEGAVTENTKVTLRFRTGHMAVDGATVRAYLFDTASWNHNGSGGYSHAI